MMKGQTAIEFMTIFFLMLLVLLIVSSTAVNNTENLRISRIEVEAEAVLNDLSAALDSAFLVGDGFSMNVTLPEKIIGLNYSVIVAPGMITLNIDKNTYFRNILSRNVSNLTEILPGEMFTVKNKDGVVLIE